MKIIVYIFFGAIFVCLNCSRGKSKIQTTDTNELIKPTVLGAVNKMMERKIVLDGAFIIFMPEDFTKMSENEKK